eukprot:1147374-Pelagomonas_calceolata.AAC.9
MRDSGGWAQGQHAWAPSVGKFKPFLKGRKSSTFWDVGAAHGACVQLDLMHVFKAAGLLDLMHVFKAAFL